MSLQPRPYQRQAIDAIIGEFDAGRRSALAVMPTGTGKTVVAAHVADHFLKSGRVLVLAHRDELIRQAAEKFETVTGHLPAIEKGEEWADETSLHGKPQIVVSSFQTQNSGDGQRKRMHRFDPKEFSFLWCDESHHLLAPSFRAVADFYLNGNPDLKMLGVTATPDRADGEALGQVFESVAFSYDLPDAIHDGYLVPIRQRSVVIDGLDFSRVRTTAGDLNAGDLEAAMIAEKPLHGVAHATIEVACGLEQHQLHDVKDADNRAEILAGWLAGKRRRKTLIFTVTVAHAERMAEILNRWVPDSATFVDGAMPMETRKRRLKDFTTGKIQFLVNCMIATEGYDEPGVELVVMARPTKSRALFSQMVGRGTRPLAEIASHLGDMPDADARRSTITSSPKPFVEILDFVGNSGRHKLVTAADILGGDYDEAVVARAKELAQEQAVDVEEALEEAEAQVEEEREVKRLADEEEYERLMEEEERKRQAEAARRAGLVGTTNYHVQDIDAFDTFATGPDRLSAVITGGATEKQVGLLIKLGVRRETALKYSKRQASAVIEDLKKKRCTVGQANYLRYLGYSDEQVASMNFEAASEAIEQAKVGAA